MKNIEYLTKFFKKHILSGKIKARYIGSITTEDEYLSEIVFEDGTILKMNDIIFDIDSDLPVGVFEQWIKSGDINFPEWIQKSNYIPDINTSSVKQFQTEMVEIVNDMKQQVSSMFEQEIIDK